MPDGAAALATLCLLPPTTAQARRLHGARAAGEQAIALNAPAEVRPGRRVAFFGTVRGPYAGVTGELLELQLDRVRIIASSTSRTPR